MSAYVVTDGKLFWNDTLGWCDLASAKRFSKEEAEQLYATLGGHFVSLEDAEAMIDGFRSSCIDATRKRYCLTNDNIQIDDNAEISTCDDGDVWVQAWVLVNMGEPE